MAFVNTSLPPKNNKSLCVRDKVYCIIKKCAKLHMEFRNWHGLPLAISLEGSVSDWQINFFYGKFKNWNPSRRVTYILYLKSSFFAECKIILRNLKFTSFFDLVMPWIQIFRQTRLIIRMCAVKRYLITLHSEVYNLNDFSSQNTSITQRSTDDVLIKVLELSIAIFSCPPFSLSF